jgi:hypothetical protein
MSRLNARLTTLLPALALAVFAGACDTTDPVGVDPQDESPAASSDVTTLKILLTDAPANYVSAAEVDIGRVEILPADDGPAIVLTDDGTDGFVDLLDFQNSATMQLAEADIEPGAYHQLRLFVEGARAQINDSDEWIDLKVPSGAQTGIKLLLRGMDGEHLQLVPGEQVIVLDFDVNRSFVIRGNPNAPGFKGVIFKPTLKVTGQDVAASISGNVSSLVEGVSAAGRTVIAEPTDAGDLTDYGYQSEAGTAVTNDDGDYTIFFLVPGEYEVSLMELEAGLGSEPASQLVTVGESENAMDVDFQIIDVTGSISGAVVPADGVEGATVEGLTVSVTANEEGAEPVETTTAEDGSYAFDGLLAGTYTVAVTFEQEGFLLDRTEVEVEVAPEEDVTGVDFTILDVGSIRGTLSTDIEGFVLEGLQVTATADGQDDVVATVGSDGTYTFTGLAAATWTLTVDPGEGYVTDPEDITVTLDGSNAFTGQDFVIEAESSS